MVVAGKKYTLDEYLTREARLLYKHEFYNGKLVRLAGAKARHNQIAANLTGALTYALRPLTIPGSNFGIGKLNTVETKPHSMKLIQPSSYVR